MERSLRNQYPTLYEDIKKLEGNTKKNNIYENVLTFPEGTDHLKYFESNPHPDKIPDIMQAFYEATPAPDLNIPYEQKMLEFNAVKKLLDPRLSNMDRLLLRLPEKMQKMIDNTTDPDKIRGYTLLRDSFINYFSTPLDKNIKPDILWVDPDFILKLDAAQNTLEDLTNNLFNPKGMSNLIQKLLKANAFDNSRKEFYFWNTSPYNWSEISYQSRSVRYRNFIFKTLINNIYFPHEKLYLSPQYEALGSFSINAIPEGYIEPKENKIYNICVTKIYFFINDIFNFDGSQPLGRWNLEHISGEELLDLSGDGINLWNSDFRNFKRHGYGRDFPVISKLKEIKNFKPICREYIIVK